MYTVVIKTLDPAFLKTIKTGFTITTKTQPFAVLRSPHVHKRSQEHFSFIKKKKLFFLKTISLALTTLILKLPAVTSTLQFQLIKKQLILFKSHF